MVQERGLQTSVTSFGGCFAFRPQRTGYKLSAHSWGIAIDLNSESNPQGSAGVMDARVIDIFRSAGFQWGGEWKGDACDPMSFSVLHRILKRAALRCALHLTTFELMGSRQRLRLGFLKTSF
jgi:hypothetical protein